MLRHQHINMYFEKSLGSDFQIEFDVLLQLTIVLVTLLPILQVSLVQWWWPKVHLIEEASP